MRNMGIEQNSETSKLSDFHFSALTPGHQSEGATLREIT